MSYMATADNTGPALLVIVFLCLIISILGVLARFGTKLWLQRRLGLDDLIIGLSLIFSVAQSVLVSREVSDGLGQYSSALASDSINDILKNQYAANMMYFLSLAFAKLSVLIFIMKLSPQKLWKNLPLGVGIGVVVWLVVSLLTVAFECALPDPWRYLNDRTEKCINRSALWTVIEIVNACFDVAIVIMPTIILAKVQTSLSKRITAITMFACRIVVVGLIIPRIFFLQSAFNSDDILFNLWIPILFAQLIVSASIVCSSMQYLKPFLDSIESGLLRADDGRRDIFGGKYGSNKSPRYGSQMSQEAQSKRTSKLIAMKRMSTLREKSNHRARRESDVESDHSESKILQTRTFEVRSEPIERLPIQHPEQIHQIPHAL